MHGQGGAIEGIRDRFDLNAFKVISMVKELNNTISYFLEEECLSVKEKNLKPKTLYGNYKSHTRANEAKEI